MHACLLALQCAFVVALIRARMATVVPCVAQTNLGRSHVRSSTQRKAPSNVEVHVPPACFSFVYVRPSCYAFRIIASALWCWLCHSCYCLTRCAWLPCGRVSLPRCAFGRLS